MKILAFGAHPDDLEMQCSGTLALYSKQGHDVFMCHVCNGDKGSLVYNSDELAKIRRKEAIEAAGLIGAESLWGGMKDCEVVLDLPARLKIIDIFRQVNPDLVITHHPDDYQVDHVNVSRLVFDAILTANVKLLESNYPSTDKTPVLYYMDTVAGVNFVPGEYVNISSTMEIKTNMMLKHKSQLGWIEKMYGIHTKEFLETIARFRGIQAGVTFAETFVQKNIFSTGLTSRILP
jgi:N-acetylglucosamine malate deacetylase 1